MDKQEDWEIEFDKLFEVHQVELSIGEPANVVGRKNADDIKDFIKKLLKT